MGQQKHKPNEMEFELKLDMYNAEQEAVWLNDFIRDHDMDDLETQVKKAKSEPGMMSGDVWMNIVIGIVSSLAANRIEWLFKKLWQHFEGKKGKIDFSVKCPKTRNSFQMPLKVGDEAELDAALAKFKNAYMELCNPESTTEN